MTSTELEQLLSKVRWQQSEISQEELSESLKAIGEYSDYLLVMVDGGLPYAPDDKNRALIPVFTSEESRRLFLDSLPKDRIQQQLYVSLSGRELFSRLAAQSIDGLVFNCLGPMQPLAFVPSFCQRVLEQLPSPPTLQDEVDDLASAAFPNLEPGPIEALDRLWRYLFELPEWFFAVHPQNPTVPFQASFEQRRRVFAFTSSARTETFARENNLVDDGAAFYLTMPVPGALEWLEGQEGLEIIHFNFGGVGWFAPIQNLVRIRRHLGLP